MDPTPGELRQTTELTALWLGDDDADLSYVDAALIALDRDAQDEGNMAQTEEIGGLALSSLYYNRPTVANYNGVPHVFYFTDCTSAPRWRIRRDRVFSTIAAGSCVAFRKYKMFYR